jgi:hypothetical protein
MPSMPELPINPAEDALNPHSAEIAGKTEP